MRLTVERRELLGTASAAASLAACSRVAHAGLEVTLRTVLGSHWSVGSEMTRSRSDAGSAEPTTYEPTADTVADGHNVHATACCFAINA